MDPESQMTSKLKSKLKAKSSLEIYKSTSSSESTGSSNSSTSSDASDTPLTRFNRLLVSSVARHWSHFRDNKLIPSTRGRSISDVGLSEFSDITTDGAEGRCKLQTPSESRSYRSSSHVGIPVLQVTAAATETEHSDPESDHERHPARLHVTGSLLTMRRVSLSKMLPVAMGTSSGAWQSRRASLPLPALQKKLLHLWHKNDLRTCSETTSESDDERRGSTGNFGSVGGGGCGAGGAPRSAPATPHQLDPTPRHSHTAHTAYTPIPAKPEKNAVKHLSSSAPSVRGSGAAVAAGTGAGSGEGEGKAPSKARQKKFLRHFPQVGPDERVLNYYSCALVGDILLQGHLYITKNYFAFYSNVFGYVTKLLIPTASVLRVSKEKMARIIPNAVGVCTQDERHVFGSLLSRDSTYKLMTHVWKSAVTPELTAPAQPEELRISEVELDVSEYSPEDESSSGGGETSSTLHPRCTRRTPVAAAPALRLDEALLGSAKAPTVIQPALLLGTSDTLARGTRGARGTDEGPTYAILVVLALVLAMSAVALAHMIYAQGQVSSIPTESDLLRLRSQDMYGELLKWQARLHSQAASEVHGFLNTNLHLLAKVRQSLEALSTMILADAGKQATLNANILNYDSVGAAIVQSSENQQEAGVS